VVVVVVVVVYTPQWGWHRSKAPLPGRAGTRTHSEAQACM